MPLPHTTSKIQIYIFHNHTSPCDDCPFILAEEEYIFLMMHPQLLHRVIPILNQKKTL